LGEFVIKAVFFDLWGTLIIDEPVAGERRRVLRIDRAHQALRDLGLEYPREDIEAGFIAAGLAHERLHGEGLDLSARGRTVFYLQHVDDRLPDRVPDAAWDTLDYAVLTPALDHLPLIMPGADDALRMVKERGLPVGLISNAGATPGYVLREILQGFGLLHHLDVAVFSDEVELAKPSPAIFEKALEMLGVDARDAAFVGDQPVLDVLGARRAGMWMVQIGDVEPEADAPEKDEPHARIAALDELDAALVRLGLIAR
jgi:putative hydrolase of the HAD superfamily